MTRIRMYAFGIVMLVLMLGSFASLPAHAANIVVVNNDGVGEGFNDISPWTPQGGNPATTVGQARLNAFRRAAELWGDILVSNVTIEVRAQMDPLLCTSGGAVLGSAGATSAHRSFSGAPITNTWYSAALANALHGSDLNVGTPDIQAQFNSNLNGNPSCVGGAEWYYGYDANPPAGDFDFITVVMHEIGHGLGFQSLVDLETGEKALGSNDTFMLQLEQAGASPSIYPNMTNSGRVAANISDPNLRWRGPNVTYIVNNDPPSSGMNGNYVRMHAPNPLVQGSSVAHWSVNVSPNEMMEPIFTAPTHDPGLATFLMADIGWQLDSSVPVAAYPEVVATVRGSAVDLRWDFAGDPGIQGFRIYRSAGAHAPEIALQGSELLDPSQRSFLDFNVEPGHAYRYSVAAVERGGSEFRSQEVRAEVSARRTVLEQNHPNPFNPSTELSYRLARDGHVSLVVFDVKGREIRTLVDAVQDAGSHTVPWDGKDADERVVSAGTYFYQLKTADAFEVRRMVLLK